MLDDTPPCAGVTLFRPDREIFDRLLETLLAEGRRVFVFVDGPTGTAAEAEHLRAIAALPGVRIEQAPRNGGIAAGLNGLLRNARAEGFERIVLFDQDSEPPPGLLFGLLRRFEALKRGGLRPALVGPLPVAAMGSGTRAPRYRRVGPVQEGATEVEFAIVSGSLLDLAAAEQIGAFDEGLRMDGVDVEWCFRARAQGYSIWVDETLPLPHRIGTGTFRFGPLRFPAQSADRMANYVASQSRLLRLAHVPLRWKMRTIAYVPLQAIAFALRQRRPLALGRRFASAALAGLRRGGNRPA